jgi:hypothetical protein
MFQGGDVAGTRFGIERDWSRMVPGPTIIITTTTTTTDLLTCGKKYLTSQGTTFRYAPALMIW